ncbi:MAG TPA: response regulator transcription factor [Acidimicrobiales bacterium]|nr:response regulator transcription factor [Acidimicrobiales bacterium]
MAEAAPLVLVIDDDPGIAQLLGAALRARDLRVASARSGQEALEVAAREEPAAIILDLGLPDMSGLEVLRNLRRWTQTPVIVLTVEGAEEAKVDALDEGANDYVTKPFSTPELLARVRVALRYRSNTGEPDPVLRVGDVEVDLGSHRASVAGRLLDLTPKEFDLLSALARQPGRVLTHRALLQGVWGEGYGRETQYLRNYASQLRKKMEDDPHKPRLVTEPGVGYRLVSTTEWDETAES